MGILAEIARIVRRGRKNRNSNALTLAIAKQQALRDISKEECNTTSKINPKLN